MTFACHTHTHTRSLHSSPVVHLKRQHLAPIWCIVVVVVGRVCTQQATNAYKRWWQAVIVVGMEEEWEQTANASPDTVVNHSSWVKYISNTGNTRTKCLITHYKEAGGNFQTRLVEQNPLKWAIYNLKTTVRRWNGLANTCSSTNTWQRG